MRATTSALALAVWLAACSGEADREEGAAGDGESGAVEVSAEEKRRLLALGYLGFSEEPSRGEGSGTVRYDPERSYPGYNLYTSRNLRLCELVDAEGRVIHRWQRGGAGIWVRAVLLDDGDLLVVGRQPGGETGGRFLLRLSWDGEPRWKRWLPVHHDVAPAPGGRWVVIALRPRSLPDLHPRRQVRDDEILLLSNDGEVEDRRSLHDVLRTGMLLRPVSWWQARQGDGPIDYFHANAVRWLDDPRLEEQDPLYSRRHLIVTIRNLDSVVIFDWDRGELVWSWGPGELHGPHDATVLPGGNVLVFDNGVGRSPPFSRVVEVDPRTGRIVWQYQAPEASDFFTLSRGANQRLAGGNTLITESDTGRAFEVTPTGEVVWEYLNPHLDAEGRRATIIRLYRYEESFVRAILEQQNRSGAEDLGHSTQGARAEIAAVSRHEPQRDLAGDVETQPREPLDACQAQGFEGEGREGGEAAQHADDQEQPLARREQLAHLDEPAEEADGETAPDVDREGAEGHRAARRQPGDESAGEEPGDRADEASEPHPQGLSEERSVHAPGSRSGGRRPVLVQPQVVEESAPHQGGEAFAVRAGDQTVDLEIERQLAVETADVVGDQHHEGPAADVVAQPLERL